MSTGCFSMDHSEISYNNSFTSDIVQIHEDVQSRKDQSCSSTKEKTLLNAEIP